MSRPPAGVVAPSHDDPVVAGLSEAIGGPLGRHARAPRRWLTPVRVLVLLAALACLAGLAQKAPCISDDWTSDSVRYQAMCYSDLPYLYVGRGLVEHAWPYTTDPLTRARYSVMEYPVGISYWAWGASWVVHWLSGSPDLTERRAIAPDALWGFDGVLDEIQRFVAVNAVGFAVLTLLSVVALAGVNRERDREGRPGRARPWDAAAFAIAPVMVATGLINWDLLAVACVAWALWAHSRGRPLLTGIAIGVGTAAKLYPLFLLGALLVICLRRRQTAEWVAAVAAAFLAWVLVDLPALLTGPDQWKVFWHFNADRGADLGSLWLVASQAFERTFTPHQINVASWVVFALWCAAVAVVGLAAKRMPRLAQLGYLVVVGFLIVNKVYSPQYVLWLLPLAALARPRWRDQLVWQGCELFYFAAVWWYLGGSLATSDGPAPVYWVAVVVRVGAELWLAALVVRDLLGGRDRITDDWSEPAERGYASPSLTHRG